MRYLIFLMVLATQFQIACAPRDVDQPVAQRTGGRPNGANTAGGRSDSGQFSQSSQPLQLASWLLQRESWILKQVFSASAMAPAKNDCLQVTKIKASEQEIIERFDYFTSDKCSDLRSGILQKEGRILKTTKLNQKTGEVDSVKIESPDLWWSYSLPNVKGAFVDLRERISIEAYRGESSSDWTITADFSTQGEHRDGELTETFQWRQGYLLNVKVDEKGAPLKLAKSDLTLTAEVKIKPFRRVRVGLVRLDQPELSSEGLSTLCAEAIGKYSITFNGGPNFKGELQRTELGVKDKKGEVQIAKCSERPELYLAGQFLSNSAKGQAK